MKKGDTYRTTRADITGLMDEMEVKYGPSPFRATFERRLVEEWVEQGMEVKGSPMEGFETNIEYMLSLIPEMYESGVRHSQVAAGLGVALVGMVESSQQLIRATEELRTVTVKTHQATTQAYKSVVKNAQKTTEVVGEMKDLMLKMYLQLQKPANKEMI